MVGRNYKPYLVLSLYPFLQPSFWCVCVHMSFVLLISACIGSVAFAKSRTEKIDRGYRFKTCNSSALDKSISDTNTITSSYTFLGFLCFTPDEIFNVCVCVYPCVAHRGAGVVGSPFESRGGLTVLDWTIFIYNRAEENRFVPDDIFIDWNMYCPPSHWKWLISGLVAAVLFLGGQGAMSTQHVGLQMNSFCFIPTWIFQSCPQMNWKERKKNHLFAVLFTKWPTRDSCKAKWDSFYSPSSSFKCHRLKKK